MKVGDLVKIGYSSKHPFIPSTNPPIGVIVLECWHAENYDGYRLPRALKQWEVLCRRGIAVFSECQLCLIK